MNTIIILPTYNESANIARIIDEIFIVSGQCIGCKISILVVDDRSPDGTAAIVKDKMTEYPEFIQLLEGQKNGLGAAYIRGMTFALKQNADLIFEMDSDFSHAPADIPRMIKAIQEGNDFVIGSRYIRGGRIPEEWSFFRKLNSWGGNIVARVVAGIYPVRDCTAGFRAIRTSLLKDIEVSEISTQGYGFQVTLLHEAYIRKARIKEIPVSFIDRAAGESKLGLSDIIEFIKNAFAIRLRGMKTLLKFLVVGGSGVFVNLILFYLFMKAGIGKYVASPLAIEVSIIWNFFLNNSWTFRQRKIGGKLVTRGLKFNMVSLLSLIISFSTFSALTLLVPDGSPLLFQAIGIIPATVVNYLTNSYWTFKEPNDLSEDHKKETAPFLGSKPSEAP